MGKPASAASSNTKWEYQYANRIRCNKGPLVDKDVWQIIIFGVSAFVLAVSTWVVASSMEAKAFNNATGKNVSTWDAMWIELRVQSSAEGD